MSHTQKSNDCAWAMRRVLGLCVADGKFNPQVFPVVQVNVAISVVAVLL